MPPEAEPYCILTSEQIEQDGDEGAREIYCLEPEVGAFITTDIARAIVDLNRDPGDRRPDGVVKTHTCWKIPVYRPYPPEDVIRILLNKYYYPYHERLRALAKTGVRLAVDCHTMAAEGPPVGPDPGMRRPSVCLSNGEGTCPGEWMASLQQSFEKLFGPDIAINHPFEGGYITRTHSIEMPWVQLELSRGPFLTNREKREAVVAALAQWVEES